ncbi:MAG: uroporphyrinogen decarboxylase family protein [Eubacteriales bacterium]|nr:uroporphyrinogen decarboxylase family protein [Eubacteriales bacterium]
MNKRERFINFLNNKPVDRVPIAFYHHYLNDMMLYNMNQGLTNKKLYEKNIEGHKLSRQKFDPDVVKIMNDSLMIMPLDVSGIKKPEDLIKIKPQAADSKWADLSINLAKKVKEIYADTDAPVFFTSFGPSYIMRSNFARIGNLMAGTRFFESKILKFMQENPEAVKELAINLSKGVVEFNQRLFDEAKIDGIYFSVNNQNNFFASQVYRDVITPGDRMILEHANSLSSMNLFHICGYRGKANDLNTFKDYEAAAYNWAVHAEGVSLSEGKRFFDGKPVFGGFEQAGVIAKGDRQQIEKEVFKILDDSGQIGVMLGADCTVPTNFDDSRLNWVREACEKYAEKASFN